MNKHAFSVFINQPTLKTCFVANFNYIEVNMHCDREPINFESPLIDSRSKLEVNNLHKSMLNSVLLI